MKKEFNYSQQWYEQEYHSRGAYNLPDRNYKDVNSEWVNLGYKERLYDILDECRNIYDFRNSRFHLEIACHHGKTAFWMLDRYPDLHIDMFDFSRVAVDWCKKHNPYPKRCNVWCDDIKSWKPYKIYESITCLDIIEHIPDDIYRDMVKKIYESLENEGFVLVMGGTCKLEEHIHILAPKEIIRDFEKQGFRMRAELSRNFILFQK